MGETMHLCRGIPYYNREVRLRSLRAGLTFATKYAEAAEDALERAEAGEAGLKEVNADEGGEQEPRR